MSNININFTPLSPEDPRYVNEEPEDFDYSSAWDVIQEIRKIGAVLVSVDYAGGSDEGFYHLNDIYDKNGYILTFPEGEDEEPLSELVVDKHFGYFSGAGDGTDYGGTIIMRLDTLQTHESDEWTMEVKHYDPLPLDWE